SAHVSGPPEGMSARIGGGFGAGRVSGTGFLTLDPHVASRFDVRAEAIDLRSFDGDAPETSLDVDANVSIALADGLNVEAAATLAPTSVSGYPIPAVRLRGSYSREGISGN